MEGIHGRGQVGFAYGKAMMEALSWTHPVGVMGRRSAPGGQPVVYLITLTRPSILLSGTDSLFVSFVTAEG